MSDDEILNVVATMHSSLDRNVFETLVENFPDIIQSVDDHGKIVSTNSQAVLLLGYSRDELIGMSIFDLYADSVRSQLKKGFRELKEEGFKDRVQSILRAKDGSEIEVEIRSLSLYDDNGNFVKTFSIIRDMREMNALRNQLVQQSKLAAIGELAASIMHDIRNPLTVILSYNGHFLPAAIKEGKVDKALEFQEIVDKATLRIKRLTDHMRSYSRSEEEPVSGVDLAALVADCLLMVEGRVRESQAALINKLEKLDQTIYCRPHQLEQVIINLVSNASDAVVGRPTREITLDLNTTTENFEISVADTGPGIPDEIAEQIFESFFTTKEKGKGTGLGLSMCRGIIANHGGKMKLETKPGQGAKFIIQLPLNLEDVKPLAS